MKYCSKCGNELFDEAVICPKCGCSVNGTITKETNTKKDKIHTAFILSVIAIVIAVVSTFTLLAFTTVNEDVASDGTLVGSLNAFVESNEAAEANRNMRVIFGGLLAISICTFIFNLIAYLKLKKGVKPINFARICFIVSIFADVIYILLSPIIFIYFICGVGVLIPVAPIMQTIAASKLLKASKE